MATAAQRKTIAQAIDLLVKQRSHVAYVQRRPMASRSIDTMPELEAALTAGIALDCSEAATLILHVAGVGDPNGNAYDGEGNTQEMYDHLPHYLNPRTAKTGALVFLGIPGRLSTQHVCVVREPGPDPLLYSHGGNGAYASHLIPYSVERRYHVGEPVFLSIARL